MLDLQMNKENNDLMTSWELMIKAFSFSWKRYVFSAHISRAIFSSQFCQKDFFELLLIPFFSYICCIKKSFRYIFTLSICSISKDITILSYQREFIHYFIIHVVRCGSLFLYDIFFFLKHLLLWEQLFSSSGFLHFGWQIFFLFNVFFFMKLRVGKKETACSTSIWSWRCCSINWNRNRRTDFAIHLEMKRLLLNILFDAMMNRIEHIFMCEIHFLLPNICWSEPKKKMRRFLPTNSK